MVTVQKVSLALPSTMVVSSRIHLARMLPVVTTALVLSAVQVRPFVSVMLVSAPKTLPASSSTMVVKNRFHPARTLPVATAPV